MITETGRIVAIEKDSLWVETISQTTCGSCSAQKGCGHGILNKLGTGRSNHIRVLLGGYHADQFQLDDQVQISIPERVVLTGSFIVYMLPLLTMLVGALLFEFVLGLVLPGYPEQDNLFAVIGALSGFIVGIVLVRWHAVKNRDNQHYQPRLDTQSNARQAIQPEVVKLL